MEKNKKLLKSRKSQITIFVIIALIIVVSIAVIFIMVRKPFVEVSASENPSAYLQNCVQSSLETNLNKLSKQGGFYEPPHFVNYNATKVSYLCYTENYDELCVNNHPMLNKEIEEQIAENIKPSVEKCFASLKSELAAYDYKSSGEMKISAEISPGKVVVSVNKEISFSKNEETTTLNKFLISANSPLFDFVSLSGKIINQELVVDGRLCDCFEESCDADTLGLSLENRGFEISKPVYSENGEIYSIVESSSGKNFEFAVRNCAKEAVR